LLPYEPAMPPRRLFHDAAHYGAMLSFLDGVDRLRAALMSEDQEQRGWYAAWAVRSFDNVYNCLARSEAGRLRGQTSRPCFHPDAIDQEARSLRLQALSLSAPEYIAPRMVAYLIL